MLKSMSTGFTCLVIATLGVAISRGQDEPQTATVTAEVAGAAEGQAIVVGVEANGEQPEVQNVEAEIVIVGGSEAGAGEKLPGEDNRLYRIGKKPINLKIIRKEGEGLVVTGEVVTSDGNVVTENVEGDAPAIRRKVVSLPTGAALDPKVRETLEKLKASLQVEIERLAKEGQQELATQKKQALEALDRLLSNKVIEQAHRQMITVTEVVKNEEIEKEIAALKDQLAATLDKLKAQTDAAVAQELQAQSKELEARMAQAKSRLEAALKQRQTRTIKVVPGNPINVQGALDRFTGTVNVEGRPLSREQLAIVHAAHAKSHALRQQAEALQQASRRLKEAGLHDQALNLAEQSEKLRDQAAAAEKHEAEHAARIQHGFVFATAGEGGPELHKSIKELQEQVQLLRKEVAELREILQQKR
ncbi:MAG: hypothetical protein JSS02_34405 [Planctomycetes bacterium]|nr:hypothetical protein [Planctomycetota bacterium]